MKWNEISKHKAHHIRTVKVLQYLHRAWLCRDDKLWRRECTWYSNILIIQLHISFDSLVLNIQCVLNVYTVQFTNMMRSFQRNSNLLRQNIIILYMYKYMFYHRIGWFICSNFQYFSLDCTHRWKNVLSLQTAIVIYFIYLSNHAKWSMSFARTMEI